MLRIKDGLAVLPKLRAPCAKLDCGVGPSAASIESMPSIVCDNGEFPDIGKGEDSLLWNNPASFGDSSRELGPRANVFDGCIVTCYWSGSVYENSVLRLKERNSIVQCARPKYLRVPDSRMFVCSKKLQGSAKS